MLDKYSKPALLISEQIELLVKRGLIVRDMAVAEHFLHQVNYYRFSAYCLPFESARHVFRGGTTFEEIRALYEFDRCLRFLIDEALEIVEISVRTATAYHLSRKYGPFVHENKGKFFSKFDHATWLGKVHEECERSTETFITHYKHKYEGFPAVPIWMAVEVMSFGGISKMIHNLLRDDQMAIAGKYSLHSTAFVSWLHTFTYVRNICAHHSRLWDKDLAIPMALPKAIGWQGVNPRRVGSVLLAINYLIARLSPTDHIRESWRAEIEGLFKTKLSVSNLGSIVGLGTTLEAHTLWKSN